VPGPTARALYLTRQHYRKTVLEGEDNNIPFQTYKKNTLKFNIIIIIKFTM
jgi:hypothetical protein